MVTGRVLFKVVYGFIISLSVIFGAASFYFSGCRLAELFVAVLQTYILQI